MRTRTRTATRDKDAVESNGKGQAAPRTRAGSAPRSMWKGVISFGMVTIPVRLYPATSSKDIAFHFLHSPCNSRIRQLRWCPVCEREAPLDELVRGYDLSKNHYVRMTDKDFESLPAASKHTIDLSAFVESADIDPIYYEKSYYLEPEGAGRKSFALLSRALTEKRKVAVAKIALREKERLCSLRPYEDALVLETLFYDDEIRVQPAADSTSAQVSEREMDMAFQLIDYLSERFDPGKYRDEYRDQLMDVIEAKASGQEIVSKPAPKDEKVIDLMSALRASIENAAAAHEKPKARRGQKAAA